MILSGKTFSQEVQLRKEKKQTKKQTNTQKKTLKTKNPDVLKSLSFHNCTKNQE